MRTLGLWLLSIILWIGVAVPAKATLVEVTATGTIPGTTTVYTCTQYPEFPPDCPSQTNPDTFFLDVVVTVDTDLPPFGYHFLEPVTGDLYADFTIAPIGNDPWGNFLFEGYNLTIGLISNPHPCPDGPPCTFVFSTYSASTFSVSQSFPALIPEPATWVMMLVGFASVGLVLRRTRKTVTPASQS